MRKVGLFIMWGTGQKKFTYKYTTFIIFTFKVPDKFISWTSRKTNFMLNFIFFPNTNHGRSSLQGTSTINIFLIPSLLAKILHCKNLKNAIGNNHF